MRILLIASQYPPAQGGGGTHSYYLASELARLGCKVLVLTATVPGLAAREEVNPNLAVLRRDFGSKADLVSTGSIKAALDAFNAFRPTLVHGQHLQGANLAMRLSAVYGVPAFVTLHKTPRLGGIDDTIFSDPTYSEIRFILASSHIKAVVAGSRAFYSELLKIDERVSAKLNLIYHGVSPGWLRYMVNIASLAKPNPYERLGLPSGDLIICPARIDRRKNLTAFVSASGQLQSRFANRSFTFLITGQPTDKDEMRYQEELVVHAQACGIQERLFFHSFDFFEVPYILHRAAACVLPSYKEGLGSVLLEAMALSVPVIATNTIGINEIVMRNEEGALLFDIGEDSELAERLCQIFSDSALCNKIKSLGRRLVTERFNARRMAKEHLSLYSKA